MTVSKSLRALTIVFFLSGLWDIIAGFVYAFHDRNQRNMFAISSPIEDIKIV